MEAVEVQTGEEATIEADCPRCSVNARVDAAIVRAGVTNVTLVSRYTRSPLGNGVYEVTTALLTRHDGVLRGEGHSREDAIVDALTHAGVHL